MPHAISDHLERQAEAQAALILDQVRANDLTKNSVCAAAQDFAKTVCDMIDDRNAALVKLAASIRSGDALMPIAAGLPEPHVNTEAVFSPPRLATVPEETEGESQREAA